MLIEVKEFVVFFFFLNLFKCFLDIQQTSSRVKSAEPVNDELRKFRNYQI